MQSYSVPRHAHGVVHCRVLVSHSLSRFTRTAVVTAATIIVVVVAAAAVTVSARTCVASINRMTGVVTLTVNGIPVIITVIVIAAAAAAAIILQSLSCTCSRDARSRGQESGQAVG